MLKSAQFLTGKIFGFDVFVDPDVAESLGGGGTEGVFAGIGGVELERRDDGQVFEVFDERVREEEFAGEMFVETD